MATDDQLSHLRPDGTIGMADVGSKDATSREAVASCRVLMSEATVEQVRAKALQKGDVLATAKIAGILAAKQTPNLIPLTHPLMLSFIDLDFAFEAGAITVQSTVRCEGKTGVEIEAMTACAVAALTIYDMCKSAEKSIVISELRLETKSGGKSGDYRRS